MAAQQGQAAYETTQDFSYEQKQRAHISICGTRRRGTIERNAGESPTHPIAERRLGSIYIALLPLGGDEVAVGLGDIGPIVEVL